MAQQYKFGNLDFLANYFYLSGYVVGKVKEVVPSNFSPDDPNQGKLVGGLTINRVLTDGQLSEVIVLTTGVAYLKVNYQGKVQNIRGAYPNDKQSAKEVVEELIKLQKEI